VSRTDETTPKIRAAMTQLGPADARTIAETAGVGYSTAVRKLRDWGAAGTVTRIDRGKDPAHWILNIDTATGNLPTGDDTDNHHNTAAGTGGDAPATNQPTPHAAAEPVQATGPDATDQPQDRDTPHAAATATPAAARPRRGKRELRDAVLSILQSNPDKPYKVSEVCKLIDQREPGRKTSAGAVANALHKFAGEGVVELTVEKPATFKAV